MNINDIISKDTDKLRIIQELVPGKQITLAHIIAAPDKVVYQKLGLNPEIDYNKAAIGILTVSPAETAVIAADIALKTSNVELGFVDRFSGTVIVTGMVSDTQAAIEAAVKYIRDTLGFSVCEVTRT
jgi:ethanolamine utilization protein EutS